MFLDLSHKDLQAKTGKYIVQVTVFKGYMKIPSQSKKPASEESIRQRSQAAASHTSAQSLGELLTPIPLPSSARVGTETWTW